jgi:hypothetical protein
MTIAMTVSGASMTGRDRWDEFCNFCEAEIDTSVAIPDSSVAILTDSRNFRLFRRFLLRGPSFALCIGDPLPGFGTQDAFNRASSFLGCCSSSC